LKKHLEILGLDYLIAQRRHFIRKKFPYIEKTNLQLFGIGYVIA